MPSETAPAPVAGRPTVRERVVVDELAYSYEGVFSREVVARAVIEARESFESLSKIPDYVPILTARYAKEQLQAAAQAEGRIAKHVPEILFICVHNAGRSQMAAAFAAHLSAVGFAGSAPSGEINPSTITVLRERGIDLTEAYRKPVSDNVVRAADVIVTKGCGEPARTTRAALPRVGRRRPGRAATRKSPRHPRRHPGRCHRPATRPRHLTTHP